jgi:ABC-2 type transport system ATP-binding protein
MRLLPLLSGSLPHSSRNRRCSTRQRLARLNIPPSKRVGALSGGQRAQIALLLALAKRPEVLLLDEPLASLDPLARREFLGVLMEAVAESGMTVLLSSHIVSDLERVCDYLIILAGGAIQVAGDIEEIVGTHRRLTGPRREVDAIAHLHTIIEVQHAPRQTSLLVRLNGPFFDPSWEAQSVSLEDVVLAYLGRASGTTSPGATSAEDTAKDRVEAGR